MLDLQNPSVVFSQLRAAFDLASPGCVSCYALALSLFLVVLGRTVLLRFIHAQRGERGWYGSGGLATGADRSWLRLVVLLAVLVLGVLVRPQLARQFLVPGLLVVWYCYSRCTTSFNVRFRALCRSPDPYDYRIPVVDAEIAKRPLFRRARVREGEAAHEEIDEVVRDALLRNDGLRDRARQNDVRIRAWVDARVCERPAEIFEATGEINGHSFVLPIWKDLYDHLVYRAIPTKVEMRREVEKMRHYNVPQFLCHSCRNSGVNFGHAVGCHQDPTPHDMLIAFTIDLAFVTVVLRESVDSMSPLDRWARNEAYVTSVAKRMTRLFYRPSRRGVFSWRLLIAAVYFGVAVSMPYLRLPWGRA